MSGRENAIIAKLGSLVADRRHADLKHWPSGEFILESIGAKYWDLLPTRDPQDWQIGARKALLQECGLATTEDTDEIVQEIWTKLANNSTPIVDPDDNDLIQFFQDSGKSNGRELQWAVMDCAPGCQFHLHAHPNLELVYCVKGALHEIRLDDDDHVLTKTFKPRQLSDDDKSSRLEGPSLLGCKRPWHFKTLRQGNWLVNRVGTVHKSFTATNGEGCILLALWGGSHANISNEPAIVSAALNKIDEKLTDECAGCHQTRNEATRILETFLPDSEKSHSTRDPS